MDPIFARSSTLGFFYLFLLFLFLVLVPSGYFAIFPPFSFSLSLNRAEQANFLPFRQPTDWPCRFLFETPSSSFFPVWKWPTITSTYLLLKFFLFFFYTLLTLTFRCRRSSHSATSELFRCLLLMFRCPEHNLGPLSCRCRRLHKGEREQDPGSVLCFILIDRTNKDQG